MAQMFCIHLLQVQFCCMRGHCISGHCMSNSGMSANISGMLEIAMGVVHNVRMLVHSHECATSHLCCACLCTICVGAGMPQGVRLRYVTTMSEF